MKEAAPKVGGMMKRGHFENQLKEGERGELSHQEFNSLDHGGKSDHMPTRTSEPFEEVC